MSMNREWENIQQRTFTRWTNAQLKKRGLKVDDLLQDLKDGVKLCHLYEVISDEKLKQFYAAPKMKFHMIANLGVVLEKINSFVESVGIKVKFSAEQINEGDKRSILGMIWVLIHKFEIQDITEEELTAKEGLLLWCKKKPKITKTSTYKTSVAPSKMDLPSVPSFTNTTPNSSTTIPSTPKTGKRTSPLPSMLPKRNSTSLNCSM
eukprot:EC824387.1.p1 GENE.EC824387.1~~EC824387.1.p1  ORF type:complete len:206 (+),score=38.07 EC824387.1:41-658(+)